jgi:hypothetical protein
MKKSQIMMRKAKIDEKSRKSTISGFFLAKFGKMSKKDKK